MHTIVPSPARALMPEFIVVGESLVDEISSDAGTVTRPGGSCLNVAVGLARLGASVTFVTSYGEDEAGALLDEHLSGLAVVRSSRPTSRAVAQLDQAGVARYDFDFSWQLDQLALSLPASSHLHVGSLAALWPPGADLVLDLVRRHEGTVSYDPNWRVGVAPADARTRVSQLMTLATVVKLSEEDLDGLYPNWSGDRLAAHLLSQGVQVVVLTRGADGAEAWTSTTHHHLPAAGTAEIVDTVGAGDAFMAAFVHEWLWDGDVRRALEFASTVAWMTCQRPGADPPSAMDLIEALPSST